VKSFGSRLPSTATERFHKLEKQIPTELIPALAPLMAEVQTINEHIASLDKEILKLCKESHPVTECLREIPGVGPVTALVFVLAIWDPSRFKRNRDVGSYLGMVPRRRQSGDEDPQLRITCAGNVYLRRLLVNAAHYVLGPFGPDSKLRRHGLAIAARGGKRAKKKAVVAVARKLAVLLLAMWKSPKTYEPFPETSRHSLRISERDIPNDVALPAACSAVS
jgi:transposase